MIRRLLCVLLVVLLAVLVAGPAMACGWCDLQAEMVTTDLGAEVFVMAGSPVETFADRGSLWPLCDFGCEVAGFCARARDLDNPYLRSEGPSPAAKRQFLATHEASGAPGVRTAVACLLCAKCIIAENAGTVAH